MPEIPELERLTVISFIELRMHPTQLAILRVLQQVDEYMSAVEISQSMKSVYGKSPVPSSVTQTLRSMAKNGWVQYEQRANAVKQRAESTYYYALANHGVTALRKFDANY